MLLPNNTNPAYSTYFYGGAIIEAMLNINEDIISFHRLFELVNNQKKISIQSFVLALDWLYLVGAVGKNSNGNIEFLKGARRLNPFRYSQQLPLLNSVAFDKSSLASLNRNSISLDIDYVKSSLERSKVFINVMLQKDVSELSKNRK